MIVKFAGAEGLKQTQHSVIFGFTSNLPPQPERVRIDTKEPVQESLKAELSPAELFSRKEDAAAERISDVVLTAAGAKGETPALKAISGFAEPGIALTAAADPSGPAAIPGPSAAPAALGGAGIGGGFGSVGGQTGTGGGGGVGFPGFAPG